MPKITIFQLQSKLIIEQLMFLFVQVFHCPVVQCDFVGDDVPLRHGGGGMPAESGDAEQRGSAFGEVGGEADAGGMA